MTDVVKTDEQHSPSDVPAIIERAIEAITIQTLSQ